LARSISTASVERDWHLLVGELRLESAVDLGQQIECRAVAPHPVGGEMSCVVVRLPDHDAAGRRELGTKRGLDALGQRPVPTV
jgi:hypothetical protein